MKIIHTADWHLGSKMHSSDRVEEQENFLKWMKEEIELEEAETLVIAGDIFDVSNPSNESRKRFFNFLASLQSTCCKNIVVVAGNHDSGFMLNSIKDLGELLNIHIVGLLEQTEMKDIVFELKDKDGEVNGICVAVPFIELVTLRSFVDSQLRPEDEGFLDASLKAVYDKALEAAKEIRGDRNIPIIATGHLYAADIEGRLKDKLESEREDDGEKRIDYCGKLGNVHSSVFSPDYDYVALGHIHYSTKVAGSERIRYSGSPFVMGFDETECPRYIHSVTLTNSGDTPKVDQVRVPQTVKYQRLSGTVEELKPLLRQSFDTSMPIRLELYYYKELGIDAHDELEPLADQLPDNVEVISWHPVRKDDEHGSTIGSINIEELFNFKEEDIFRDFIYSKFGLTGELSDDPEVKEEENKKNIELYNAFMDCFDEAALGNRSGEDEET